MLTEKGKLIVIVLVIASAVAFIFTQSLPIAAPPLIALMALSYLNLLWKPRAVGGREIKIKEEFLYVTVRVKTFPESEVLICDEIPEGLLLESAPCIYTWTGMDSTATLIYKGVPITSGKIKWGDIVLKVAHPSGLFTQKIRLAVPTYIEVRTPRLREAGFIELIKSRSIQPSVDWVKPYSPGDELRLLLPKSIGWGKGLRLKVLEKAEDIEIMGKELFIVTSKYFCLSSGLSLKAALLALDISNEVNVISSEGIESYRDLSKLTRELCQEHPPLNAVLDLLSKGYLIIVAPDIGLELLNAINEPFKGYLIILPYELPDKLYELPKEFTDIVLDSVREFKKELDLKAYINKRYGRVEVLGYEI